MGIPWQQTEFGYNVAIPRVWVWRKNTENLGITYLYLESEYNIRIYGIWVEDIYTDKLGITYLYLGFGITYTYLEFGYNVAIRTFKSWHRVGSYLSGDIASVDKKKINSRTD